MTLRCILRRLFRRPTATLDFVGYEVLIDFIREKSLYRLDGDLVEIGTFMGGGTAKLARFAAGHEKRVFAIDIFNPAADTTKSRDGTRMSEIYLAYLEGSSQWNSYRNAVRDLNRAVERLQRRQAKKAAAERKVARKTARKAKPKAKPKAKRAAKSGAKSKKKR